MVDMIIPAKIKCTDGKKDAVALSVGRTVIGRGHLLQIRELKVSRHHAEVQITEDGEFILKAMHPGLPCYYRKKGDNSNKELVRGATVTMENGDLFSLHSNPDCEFAVIQNTSLAKNGTEESDDDEEKIAETAEATKEVGKSAEKEAEDDAPEEDGVEDQVDEEEEEAEEGSDWDEKPVKKKSPARSKAKKKTHQKPKPSAPTRRPPARSRKPPSSEEEEVSENSPDEEESEDSDYGARRGRRRQPERKQPRLPARRSAAKSVNYNEDVLYGAISSEEEKVESDDGLPQIGRQKKPDSDSDFQVDEESGSDWEQASKPVKKSAPPARVSGRSKAGAKRRKPASDSDEFLEDEEEYIPRPSKRRSAAAAKSKKSSSEEEEEEEEIDSEASE